MGAIDSDALKEYIKKTDLTAVERGALLQAISNMPTLTPPNEPLTLDMLYAAAWRAARAMGYHKLITYILDSENGSSLRAAGWKCVGQAGGLRWTGKRRPEVDLCPAQMKIKFEIDDGKQVSP